MVYLWDSMVRVLIYCILIFDLFDFVQLSYMYVTSLLGYLGDLGLLSETYNSSSFLAACVPLMLTVYLASIYTYIFCIVFIHLYSASHSMSLSGVVCVCVCVCVCRCVCVCVF